LPSKVFILAVTVLLSGWGNAQRRLAPADVTRFPEMTECALSPDGTLVAVTGREGSILLYRVDGSGSCALPIGRFRATSLRWSADGRKLAFLGGPPGSNLWVVDVASGKSGDISAAAHSNFWLPEVASGLEWSPESSQLAFIAADPVTRQQMMDPRVITRLQFKSRTDSATTVANISGLSMLAAANHGH
jgi:Tol biopolymer transport system component